jgi:hypothetical protein
MYCLLYSSVNYQKKKNQNKENQLLNGHNYKKTERISHLVRNTSF